MTVATGNEVQVVDLGSPSAGDFTLDFDGEETAAIAFDATNAAVKSALVALSNLVSADVTVTGSAGGPYTVTFAGAYADTNVPELIVDGSGLTDGDPDVSTSSQGNPPVNEPAYVDISDPATGLVANLEVLPGQTPPAGKVLVDKDNA